jgi:hypothetical protein
VSDPRQQHDFESSDQAKSKPEQKVIYRFVQLRFAESPESQAEKQPDNFSEPVTKAVQEPFEAELVQTRELLRGRHLFGLVASVAVAAGAAALVALFFAVAPAYGPIGQEDSAALPNWKSLRSSLFQAPSRKHTPTLIVRDGSGAANEPLSLGVSVSSPGPGATVVIGGMPAGAKVTVGEGLGTGQWRVAAHEISDASIVPPVDFVGVLSLTAELRDSEDAALINGLVRLSWSPASPVSTVGGSESAVTSSPDPATVSALAGQPPVVPPEPPRAAPARNISPDEVAGFVRRAQDLLTVGDLQAARLLLLRATEANDALAAFTLAKTFDPMISKQTGATESENDLAQARNWYRKAEEWGAPEAHRQLEALAGYGRQKTP